MVGFIRMPDRHAAENQRLASAEELVQLFRTGQASPVEIAELSLSKIDQLDGNYGAVLARMDELAREQAKAAEQAYRDGSAGPLAGVPVTIKDTFDVAGFVTTRGSLVYQNYRAFEDSGVVRRLRKAGAVFVGKTNTAECGQSATNENRLPHVVRNPWNTEKSPGGSSGGAAVSVAAGYAPLALGADGGGSIRIPASFTGVYGIKPTYASCKDEGGFRGMSEFCCPGPLSNKVADARRFLGVLMETEFGRREQRGLRIAYIPSPEGKPVDSGVAAAVQNVAQLLQDLGHNVEQPDLDLSGWFDVFGPLVLAEEWRERGHILDIAPQLISNYELSSLNAARDLTPEKVASARTQHVVYRTQVDRLFDTYDIILTPTTATTTFDIGTRPDSINGVKTSRVWGPFPFTAAFNVAGNPAASIPCGLANELPVGAQLVARVGADHLLLDISEALEEAIGFQYLGKPSTAPRNAESLA